MRRTTSFTSLEWLFFVSFVLVFGTTTRAFTPSIINTRRISKHHQHRHHCMTADDFSLPDCNDIPIKVGSTVKVVAKGLQAHQVPAKAYGSYDSDGNFVPSDTAKTLELPVGLMGRVTKLYNNEEVSANYPIQVKFEVSENEQELNPPVPFVMHFVPKEVELIVE